MANNSLKQHESNVISQLGTYTYNIPVAGPGTGPGLYNIRVTAQVVTQPSSLSIVINQNGSPVASSAPPSPAQEEIDIQVDALPCATGDAITIVYSSAAQSDQLPNAFKSIAIVTQSI